MKSQIRSGPAGWLGTGPKVRRFETAFRNYVGAKYAIAVNSCTAALHLSLLAIGLEPGDEVITTPMTFTATAAAIISYNSWNLARLFEQVGFKVRESFCFPLRLQLFPELPIKSRFGYWLFSIADRE